jgi:parvulin-like peptidyl-prolyl isomerase
MFKHLIYLSILSISLGLPKVSLAATIAKVGDQTISDTEFKKSYAKALENGASLNRLPTKEEHLQDMIKFKLGLIEAEKTNLKSNPLVAKALELELYKGLLEVNLAGAVNKIKVSEKEMQTYYKNNPYMRSSHIFIRLPKAANTAQIAEASKRADKIYNSVVKNKSPWSVQVRKFTDDTQSKTTEGDLGYHGSNTLHPAYYDALKALQINSISKPVKGLFGFHIIKKTGQLSYERSDKNAIKLAVFNQKRYQIFDKYFKGLASKHKVSVNKNSL